MEEMYFEKKYVLRTSDFDFKDKIRISAILDLTQSIAGLHADMLGVSYEELKAKDMFWVISGLRFTLKRNPKADEEITIKTWPLKPAGARFIRDCVFTDKDGNDIILVETTWIVITIDRKIVRPANVRFNSTNYFDKSLYNDNMPKICFDENKKYNFKSHIVRNSDLDHNGHMNNAKYGDLILDIFAPIANIKSFVINFNHEALCGEEIKTYYYMDERENGIYYFEGVNEDRKFYTAMLEMEIKDE